MRQLGTGCVEGSTPLSFQSEASVQSAEELMTTPDNSFGSATDSFESFADILEMDSVTVLFPVNNNLGAVESFEDAANMMPMHGSGGVDNISPSSEESDFSPIGEDGPVWSSGSENLSESFLEDVIALHYNNHGFFGEPSAPMNSVFEASSFNRGNSMKAARSDDTPRLTIEEYMQQQELLGYLCDPPAWKPPPGLPAPPSPPPPLSTPEGPQYMCQEGDNFDTLLDKCIIHNPIMMMGGNNFPIPVLQHLVGFKIVGEPDWDILEMLMY